METKKHGIKRPKSATRYPRKNSTYVVAFALHETYDDLATAQQMICNRKSPKDNVSATSLTLVTETVRKDSNPSQHNLDQSSSEISVIDLTDTNVTAQNNNNHYVPDHIDTDKFQKGDTKEDMHDQPQVIFSAKHNKRPRNKKQDNGAKSAKRSHKNKGALEIRNIHFKYRNSKIDAVNKLGKFYSKARKSSVLENLKLCSNSMTNVVSKTRILKKVSAKENLLDENSLFDIADLEQSDMGSVKSSVSTVKQRSCASQNTLIRKSSTDLSNRNTNMPKDQDQDEPESRNSAIKISSETTFPYKTDILNVALAVTYNPNQNDNVENKKCKEISNDDLTSAEATAQSSATLTSYFESSTLKTSEKTGLDSFEGSDYTLTASDNHCASDSDTYVISEQNSISKTIFFPDLASQNTVPNIDNKPTIHKIPNEKSLLINKKQALLDTIINLGFFSELNPIGSTENVNEINDQIKDSDKNINKNNGDHQIIKEKKPAGVLQKPFTTEKSVLVQRKINLPSEDVIKNMFIDRENLQKKTCSEEDGTHPTTISELWERIVVILDLTVKRLEDNLIEKIVKELTKSSPAYEKLARPIPDLQPIEEAASAKTLTDQIKPVTANESVQCDLVKKQMIDNIMLKLSIQNTKPAFPPSTSKIPLKIKKPKLINDFVEVLKPPATENVDVEQGDTVTISTDFAPMMEETSEYERFDRFKSILHIPLSFVRENLVVIASVTNFFVILLCIYGFFVLVIK